MWRVADSRSSAMSRSSLVVCNRPTLGLGAYLVQAMFIEAFETGRIGVQLRSLGFLPPVAIPLQAVVVFGTSIAVTFLTQRSRFFRWMVHEGRSPA